MSEMNGPNGSPDGGSVGTPAASAAAGTPADAGTGASSNASPAQPADAGGWRNVEEIKAALKATRENEKLLKSFLPIMQKFEKWSNAMAPDGAAQPSAPQAPVPQGGDAMQEIVALKRQLALKDAFDEHRIPQGPMRKLIEQAAQAGNVSDVRAFVAEYAALGTQPAAPSQPAQSAPVTNTGAPSAQSSAFIPENPSALLPEVVANMTPAQKRAHWMAFRAKSNRNANPFAAKARPDAGVDANAVLAALTKAVNPPKR